MRVPKAPGTHYTLDDSHLVDTQEERACQPVGGNQEPTY